MINKVQCPEGHFYNANKFEECPICNPDAILSPKNEALLPPELPKTEALLSPELPETATIPPPDPPKTETLPNQSLQEELNEVDDHTDTDDLKTMAVWTTPGGNEPVVGWLVCVKGEYIGRGFNIKAGNNFIGRSVEMDIRLDQEMKVARNKHCIISYEPENQEFFLQQGDSRSLTYLNGEVVMTPKKMEARDIMKIGDAEFIFVPLCVDGFSWETFLQNREDDKSGAM